MEEAKVPAVNRSAAIETDETSATRETACLVRRCVRRRHRRMWPTVTVSLACIVVLLLTSLPTAAATSSGNPPPPTGVSPNTLDYVYDISPSVYPAPSSLASSGPTGLVSLVALTGGAASFGMVNTSLRSAGGSSLWFESGGYDPSIAAAEVKGTCPGGTCPPTVPIDWNLPVRIANLTSTVVADSVVEVGSEIVVAASSGGSTEVWNSTTEGATWTPFGSAIAGTLHSLSANSSAALLVTSETSGWTATTLDLSGAISGQASLTPSGGTGILSASGTFVDYGFASLIAVAFSVAGTDQVQFQASRNGGATYSAAQTVGAFADSNVNPDFSSIGATDLAPAGWVPGQVALVGVGSALVVSYPTLFNGNVGLVTRGSANYGTGWDGPYLSGPVTGSILNLTLVGSLGGLVYASWDDAVSNVSTPEMAIFFSDGSPMVPPTSLDLPASFLSASGAPSIAVDTFQRPLLAWPTSEGGYGIAFTGDFLGANESLSLVDQMVKDPLVNSDFSTGTSQATFNASIATASSAITTGLTTNHLCNAQNSTALSLYSNLTHLPLDVLPGSGTVCVSGLTPNEKVSPIVPEVGASAPNTYLAVYADWLLEALAVPLGDSPMVNATTSWGVSVPALGSPKGATQVTTFSSTGQSGWSRTNTSETITVQPYLYNPTSLDLMINAIIPGGSSYSPLNAGVHCTISPPAGWWSSFSANYTLVKTWANVSIDNGTVHAFSASPFYPSPWVTNLTPSRSYYWKVILSPQYAFTMTGSWPAGCSPMPQKPFTAQQTTFTGTLSTQLPIGSESHSLHATFTSGSNSVPTSVGFSWATCAGNWIGGSGYCMGAASSASLTDLTTGGTPVASWSPWYCSGSPPPGTLDPCYLLPTTFGHFGAQGTLTHNYQASFWSTSLAGGWNSAEIPGYSYTAPVNAQPQTASWSFQFTLTPPSVNIWGWNVSGITATTAQLTWYANSAGSGYVTLSPEGGGANVTVNGIPGVSQGGGSWKYSVEVHGLEPWTVYGGMYGVAASGSWYTDFVSGGEFPSFKTWMAFALSESDAPFDSITDTGGGAVFRWNLPNALATMSPVPVVTGGTLWVWNATTSESMPVQASEVNQTVGSYWYDVLNYSGLSPNTLYHATMELNYSTSPAVSAFSQNYNFTHLKDSSGDGLSDAEKTAGWNVTYTAPEAVFHQSIPDALHTVHVQADPAAFATNGLVGDYVEKAFDLNPITVDTAGSHLLETWNLTFDLGLVSQGSSPPSTSLFQYWYENSTSPFNGNGPSTADQNLTNLTPTIKYGGDGSPWAATVLWSHAALSTFENLSGVRAAASSGDWLRAVTGTWKGVRTLTVWGKLSWGANPLAQSTRNDGAPDGLQPDPV